MGNFSRHLLGRDALSPLTLNFFMDDLIPKDFGSAANGVELLSGLRVVH